MVRMPVHPAARNACRRALQARGAHGEAAPVQFAVHFLVDRQEGRAQRRIREAARQPAAVAPRRREFPDGAGQRRAEPGHARHARELGTVHAPHRLLHDQVQRRIGRLRRIAGPRRHEFRERLNQPAPEDEAFARDAVLQVLGHGRGRHQQADMIVARAQGLAKPLQTNAVLPEPAGPVSNCIWLQCTAGEEKEKLRMG